MALALKEKAAPAKMAPVTPAQLIMNSARTNINNEAAVLFDLRAIKGAVCVKGGGTARDNYYNLGLPKLGLDIMAKFPTHEPNKFLDIQAEVILVMKCLCLGDETPPYIMKPRHDVWDTVMESYATEVLKLMRTNPTDPALNAISLQFLDTMIRLDEKYAWSLHHMGTASDGTPKADILDHVKWAMENYTTPTGAFAKYANSYYNVHYAGAKLLSYLAGALNFHLNHKDGMVEVLQKAATNPEGAYGKAEYAAREPACNALAVLSVDYAPCRGHSTWGAPAPVAAQQSSALRGVAALSVAALVTALASSP
jgi:hypothetical protein